MSVGLPGSGIGGVFYLLSALWMPVHSVQRSVTGGAPKVRQAFQQVLLAITIITMLWLTGATLEWVIAAAQPGSSLAAVGSPEAGGVPQVLRAASLALTLGTLAFVLLCVQILRFVVPARIADPETHDSKIERRAA